MASGDAPSPDPHHHLSRFFKQAFKTFRDEFDTADCADIRGELGYLDVRDPAGPDMLGLCPLGEAAGAVMGHPGMVDGMRALKGMSAKTMAAAAPVLSQEGRMSGVMLKWRGGKAFVRHVRPGHNVSYILQGGGDKLDSLHVAGDMEVACYIQTFRILREAADQMDIMVPAPATALNKSLHLLNNMSKPRHVKFLTSGAWEDRAVSSVTSRSRMFFMRNPFSVANVRSSPPGERLAGAEWLPVVPGGVAVDRRKHIKYLDNRRV